MTLHLLPPDSNIYRSLYPPARSRPSHETIRCQSCGSRLLVRLPESPGVAPNPPPARPAVKEWLESSLSRGCIIGTAIGLALWAILCIVFALGFVWVQR